MSETFSINREFDFVRLEGLRRATGRPAHEWDLYIVKELVDNALDADETLWHQDPDLFPDVEVRIEYRSLSERQSRQLLIDVSNRAAFPVTKIESIFATGKYTSSKTFVKGLTRGSLGNALKTLLGIPYALHNRSAGGWRPQLKPMYIVCKNRKYQPRYSVDRTAQVIRFECLEFKTPVRPGTLITIGVDAFDQERPRKLTEIQQLAALYHLVNPHARFRWIVEINDDAELEWRHIYEPNPNWNNKHHGPTPIQWYSAAAFQELISVLYQKEFSNERQEALPVTAITRYFKGFTTQNIQTQPDKLTKADIEGPAATKLYLQLIQASSKFKAAELGAIGSEHLNKTLRNVLPLNGNLFYNKTASDSDPNIPFVLEAAAAYLDEGNGREVLTAVNFTPTYGDPFMRAWLYVPIQPEAPALGLRGVTDAYGLTEETPVVIFLHLICPNIEHSEFSKTDINHLPFKQVLGEVLDKLLTTLQQSKEEAELRLQAAVFHALDTILAVLGANERFIFGQLLEKLKAALRRDPELTDWLARPEAEERLRAYIANFQSQNTVLTQRVARSATSSLTIPIHPDRHFSTPVEHVTRELLAQQHVNKILFIQGRELEPVIVENQWLCQMDMALLHNSPDIESLRQPLIQLLSHCELPILVLHDATQAGQMVFKRMHEWLERADIDSSRLVDIGLTNAGEKVEFPTRLVEMMPDELAVWLIARLQSLKISLKFLPDLPQLRQDIRQQIEQSLQSNIWEGLGQQLAFGKLMLDLDQELGLTNAIIDAELDTSILERLNGKACAESYRETLKEIVQKFHVEFMLTREKRLHKTVKSHLEQVRNNWE